METFDELQKSWNENKARESAALNKGVVVEVIAAQIRKERNKIFRYFWASYFWQFLIYASLGHLMVRYWGEGQTVILCAAGILMYLPFTTVFIKKYNRMAWQKSNSSAQNVLASLQMQHSLLTSFFRFKKKFDWIGIPITCLLLTAIIFKLWVPNGWAAHVAGAIISYVLILSAFLIATFTENRRSFKVPLEGLRLVMSEMQEE